MAGNTPVANRTVQPTDFLNTLATANLMYLAEMANPTVLPPNSAPLEVDARPQMPALTASPGDANLVGTYAFAVDQSSYGAADAIITYTPSIFDDPHTAPGVALQNLLEAYDYEGRMMPDGFWCRPAFFANYHSQQRALPADAACTPEQFVPAYHAPAAAPASEQTFSWAQPYVELGALEPGTAVVLESARIVQQMFASLLTLGPGYGPVRPAAAVAYDVSPDQRQYTFCLRPNAQWSDGRPVVAHDFVAALQRLLSIKNRPVSADLVKDIANALEFLNGTVTDFSHVGIRALNDTTVQYTLRAPNPLFPIYVTQSAFAPIPADVVAQYGNAWTAPEHIVVNGAYTLVTAEHDSQFVLRKNPHYWRAADVHITEITIRDVHGDSQEQTARDWYINKKIQWTGIPMPPTFTKSFDATLQSSLVTLPHLGVEYVGVNAQRPPLDNPLVRAALNLAIDKGRMVRQVLGNGEKTATVFMPKTFGAELNFTVPEGTFYDLAKAQKSLADAGYQNGARFPELTILYDTGDRQKLIVEYLVDQWKKGLNITVQGQGMERGMYVQHLATGDFQLIRHRWLPDFPAPEAFLDMFHTGREYNFPQYHSPQYDDIIERMTQADNQTERNRTYVHALTLLNRDLPVLPLDYMTGAYLLDPRIAGFEPQPNTIHPVEYMYVRAE